MEPDETEWIRRIRSGEPEAFAAVHRRFAGRVLGFTYRLTSNRAEAEDLAQEVFVAAYRSHAAFQGRSGLLT
ncbi:MAG: RNA polymerase sigma factor [Armatimonadota bacterium]